MPSCPFVGPDTFLLSAGILGATVMPHVVYLHSALTQDRIRPRNDRRSGGFPLHADRYCVAMPLAGVVNGGMLIMAAVVFHQHGLTTVSDLGVAYKTLTPLLGPAAATVFADLAAGLGPVQLDGGHDGRPGDHARVRRLLQSPLAAAVADHVAVVHRDRHRTCQRRPRW